MSDTIYQVYFTNKYGEREYINRNFYYEALAQEAVEKLIDIGFEDAVYVGFTFTIGGYPE